MQDTKPITLIDPGTFNELSNYCMFIGYPRSGHSLVGALLNAHPNAVIAHELDALSFVQDGYGKEEIFSLLIQQDQWFAKRQNRWSGYNYSVPNQWQGRFEQLKVIGDKKGGGSADILLDSPELLAKLRSTITLPVKLIHVVRNPFDNITSMSEMMDTTLEIAIERYFELADFVNELLKVELNTFTIYHEAFIQHPERTLQSLCECLGLDTNDNYLNDCAGIVFRQPTNKRHSGAWTANLIDDVIRRAADIPYLKHYRFEE